MRLQMFLFCLVLGAGSFVGFTLIALAEKISR